MNNCVKSMNMENMYLTHVDIYDDFNKNKMCSNQ